MKNTILKSTVSLFLVIILLFANAMPMTVNVQAAHKHSYTQVVKYQRNGWLKHKKTVKCKCGQTKVVNESCTPYLVQKGGIKGYYFTFLPGTPGEPHSHNEQCTKCKNTHNLGCQSKTCR